MEDYLRKNRDHWDEVVPHHERSEFYDVDGFRAGRCSLQSIELEELGDVSGTSLLHLQCHFGLDTMSWARLGAVATGVDFSNEAINLARRLSAETGIKADFICANIYDLPGILQSQFDIVFTSYGVLCWLPDLARWGEVIARFVRPRGIFYMVADHPIANVFDDSPDSGPKVGHPYFHTPKPDEYWPDGTYAVAHAGPSHPIYEWRHSLADVVNALISAGLTIEFLHEFPVCAWRRFPSMTQDDEGWWRLPGDPLPLTFSLKATKP